MHELNIQTICANTSSAKGRVERAHLTLQDRLVKELRLRGISSVDAANDYADEFMTNYNRRFAKAPGMTLMFTGHLKLMMIWPHLSHGGSRAEFQNPLRYSMTKCFILLKIMS